MRRKAQQPIRVLFDTNIYTTLIKNKNWLNIMEEAVKTKQLIVYSCPIIRKEIRATGDRKLRLALLGAHDSLVSKIIQTDPFIKKLALVYQDEIREHFKARASRMYEDCLIVAHASLKRVDYIATEDLNTMGKKEIRKIFMSINGDVFGQTPTFLTFKELLQIVRRL